MHSKWNLCSHLLQSKEITVPSKSFRKVHSERRGSWRLRSRKLWIKIPKSVVRKLYVNGSKYTPNSELRNRMSEVVNWKSEAGSQKILRQWSDVKLRTRNRMSKIKSEVWSRRLKIRSRKSKNWKSIAGSKNRMSENQS